MPYLCTIIQETWSIKGLGSNMDINNKIKILRYEKNETFRDADGDSCGILYVYQLR